jgi:hypothetical protein
MNKQQLIDNATAKKFTIEFDQTRSGAELIGINKGKWNYHWFEVFGDNEVIFLHSYSQLTGKTKKGWKHRMQVCDSLGYFNY